MSSYQLTDIREICPICWDTDDSPMVVHNSIHPIHLKCVKVWYKTSSNCPICRSECDLTQFMTLKDRLLAVISIEDLLNSMAIISLGNLLANTEFSLLSSLFVLGLVGCIFRDTGEITIIKIGLIAAYFYYLRTHPYIYSGLAITSSIMRQGYAQAAISLRNAAYEIQNIYALMDD